MFEGPLIGNLNSICHLSSPLPYNLTYSQALRVKTWTFGAIILCTIVTYSVALDFRKNDKKKIVHNLVGEKNKNTQKVKRKSNNSSRPQW